MSGSNGAWIQKKEIGGPYPRERKHNDIFPIETPFCDPYIHIFDEANRLIFCFKQIAITHANFKILTKIRAIISKIPEYPLQVREYRLEVRNWRGQNISHIYWSTLSSNVEGFITHILGKRGRLVFIHKNATYWSLYHWHLFRMKKTGH